MKAIGYIRVSTNEQASEGVSLDNQTAKIKQYCETYGLQLVETISDPGESGKNLKRPGIQRLLGELKNIDAVVVYKLDRLSRKVLDTLETLREFEKNKVDFHSVMEKIDTGTAAGKFFLNITASFAQMERDLTAERTTDALQFKKKNGELVGSVPYGKRLDNDGIHLIDDADELETIRLAMRWRAKGASLRTIAKELTRKKRQCRGCIWYAQTVKNIIGAAS
jgi:site-specific DNA recombinase